MRYRVTVEVVEDREFFVTATTPAEAEAKALAALRNGEAPADWEWVRDTVRTVETWPDDPASPCMVAPEPPRAAPL